MEAAEQRCEAAARATNRAQQVAASPTARVPGAARPSSLALRQGPKELLRRQRRRLEEDEGLNQTRKRRQIDQSVAKRRSFAAFVWEVFAAKEEGNG